MRRLFCVVAIAACGSSQPPTASGTAEPSDADRRAARQREELRARKEREEIVTKHRKLESAQQDALAASCKDTALWAKQHCTPTCYPAEAKDPRAGTKVGGATAIEHRVCRRQDEQLLVVDELDPKLQTKAFAKRFPKAAKKGTWQADVATWFAGQQGPKFPKRDAIAFAGTWQTVQHPLTHESLECVTLVHYTTLARGKLDDCGGRSKVACEASGNEAARGINLLHYRLAEARQLQSAGNETGCSQAALEAVATARGLPRWRQYAKLNVDQWIDGLAYRTRFDGTLDEDALFAAAATLGTEAERLYAECAGMNAKTTPEQEHAFHSCP